MLHELLGGKDYMSLNGSSKPSISCRTLGRPVQVQANHLPDRVLLNSGARFYMCKATLMEGEQTDMTVCGPSAFSPMTVYHTSGICEVSVKTIHSLHLHMHLRSSDPPFIGPNLIECGLFNNDNTCTFAQSVFNDLSSQYMLFETMLVVYWRSKHWNYLE